MNEEKNLLLRAERLICTVPPRVVMKNEANLTIREFAGILHRAVTSSDLRKANVVMFNEKKYVVWFEERPTQFDLIIENFKE